MLNTREEDVLTIFAAIVVVGASYLKGRYFPDQSGHWTGPPRLPVLMSATKSCCCSSVRGEIRVVGSGQYPGTAGQMTKQ